MPFLRQNVSVCEQSYRVRRVLTGEENIAGIAIPTFDRVEFEPADWDLFDTEWYVDDAVQHLRSVSLDIDKSKPRFKLNHSWKSSFLNCCNRMNL